MPRALITFLDAMHLIFCRGCPLTRKALESILLLYDELLPDDVLFLRVLHHVSHDTHLWPEEFPDLA